MTVYVVQQYKCFYKSKFGKLSSKKPMVFKSQMEARKYVDEVTKNWILGKKKLAKNPLWGYPTVESGESEDGSGSAVGFFQDCEEVISWDKVEVEA